MRKGRQAAYLWTGPGRYELILNKTHNLENVESTDDVLDEEEGESESLICMRGDEAFQSSLELSANADVVRGIDLTGSATLASRIARHLAEVPFRAHVRRQPYGPVRYGLGERLDAYFWSTPDKGWLPTCHVLAKITAKIPGGDSSSA